MTRRAARVTQTEVENTVRGFEAAGKRAAEIRVLPDGTIVVSSDFTAARETLSASSVDALLDEAEHGAR